MRFDDNKVLVVLIGCTLDCCGADKLGRGLKRGLESLIGSFVEVVGGVEERRGECH